MVKFVALYSRPADPEAFDKRYQEHLALALAMPNVKGIRLSKAAGAARGEPPVYQISEVLYADQETMMASLSSPEGMRAYKDILRFAKDLVKTYFSDETEHGRK